jgi:hypothetical protein
MGRILVKSPAMLAPARAGIGNALQEAFRVKTRPGQLVGGALGGIAALTSLADASEAQQDAFNAAQTAAGRGVGTYIGAGKVGDTASQAVGERLQDRRDRRNQVGRYNAPRSNYAQGAAPEASPTRGFNLEGQRTYTPPAPATFDPNFFDEVDAQQTAMNNLSRQYQQTGGAYGGNRTPIPFQPGERYGEEVQLGPYQTMSAEQANQILGGQVGVKPSYSMSLEHANSVLGPQSPQQPNFQSTPFSAPTSFDPTMFNTNATIGSTQVGMPAQPQLNAADLSPEEVDAFYESQRQVKNAGEPMELAFMLLKSVMQ